MSPRELADELERIAKYGVGYEFTRFAWSNIPAIVAALREAGQRELLADGAGRGGSMSNDDETVERVARALAAEASTTEMGAAGFNSIHRKEYVEICWRDHEDRARAAISALPPRDELLREALEALDRVLLDVEFMWEDGTLPNRRDDVIYVRARAAADKIRAALTQEKQT